MTRAQDTLILTAPSRKKSGDALDPAAAITTQAIVAVKSYADWLGLWFAQNQVQRVHPPSPSYGAMNSPQSTVHGALAVNCRICAGALRVMRSFVMIQPAAAEVTRLKLKIHQKLLTSQQQISSARCVMGISIRRRDGAPGQVVGDRLATPGGGTG